MKHPTEDLAKQAVCCGLPPEAYLVGRGLRCGSSSTCCIVKPKGLHVVESVSDCMRVFKSWSRCQVLSALKHDWKNNKLQSCPPNLEDHYFSFRQGHRVSLDFHVNILLQTEFFKRKIQRRYVMLTYGTTSRSRTKHRLCLGKWPQLQHKQKLGSVCLAMNVSCYSGMPELQNRLRGPGRM